MFQIIISTFSIGIATSFSKNKAKQNAEVQTNSKEKLANNKNEELAPEIQESIKAKWNSNCVVDFKDEAVFEKALNDGENVVGKTVTFTVQEIHPGTAWGVNLWAGEHLNFYSEEEVGIEGGDKITVLVTFSQRSDNSYLLKYVLLEKEGGKPQRDGFRANCENQKIELASCSFELPGYWEKAKIEKNYITTYAERGKNIVMLHVSFIEDTSNFDIYAHKEEFMDGLISGMTENYESAISKTTYKELSVKAGKGIMAENTMRTNYDGVEIGSTYKYFILPVNNRLFVFVLSTSDQSNWSYSNDFEKILNTIKY